MADYGISGHRQALSGVAATWTRAASQLVEQLRSVLPDRELDPTGALQAVRLLLLEAAR